MKKLIVVLALLACGAALHGQEAFIKEFSGTVEVQDAGASGWTPARAGQQIRKDTVISTGFKSMAVIGLGNSSLILRPLTRLSLEELTTRQGDEEVGLYLHTGRIRAEVKPPEERKTSFTVRSPSVTASVRGTAFEFDGADLRVDEGVVHVTGGDNSGAYVGAGHQAVSDPETGRMTAGMEAAIAGLSPAIPAAAAESMTEPAAILPEAVDSGLGFNWD
jgi:hypothetical protein